MDFTTIATTLTALINLTKTVGDGVIDEQVQAKAVELNNSIIGLQSALFELQAKNHALLEQNRAQRDEMMKMQQWSVETMKYQLVELAPGVFVYAYQPDENNTQPQHYLCPHCYQKEFKSLLQCRFKNSRGTHYFCPHCDMELTDPQNSTPLDMPISRSKRPGRSRF